LSNDYSSPFAAGTYRQGISDTLTAQSRLELGTERQAIGADITSVIGTLGSFTLQRQSQVIVKKIHWLSI
jgi:outer membrane usher protein